MESSHDEDGNKQVSGDVEHHSETRSRSSSSSSTSSSSYTSPPKHLPEDNKESSSNDQEVSQIDSPRVQVMNRDDNNGEQGSYDPNRIPSSVFERSKSNIQAEWSCASNESLFSLHLGRNSFTVDMMKSGELYKSGELLAYSPALPMPPPPGGESTKSKVVDSNDEKQTLNEEEEEKRESQEKEQHPVVSWKTPTTSYRSTRSSNSTHSFSFPILAGAASESGKKETEEHKKQVKQSQESQQAADVANEKQTMCKWLSCFPSCPWCCYSHSSCSCT